MGTNKEIPDWLNAEVADYDIPLAVPPKTVLDIGANIGAFSLRAASMWPDCVIQAYEPLPDSAESYHDNCGNGRFHIHQAAVRSFTGVDKIRMGKASVLTCSFHNLQEQSEETVEVKCLDAATLESAEFLKIDTEGCETEILKRIPLENTRAIACEFHLSRDKRDILEFCNDNGFECISRKHLSLDRGVLKFIRKGEKLVPLKHKVFIGIPIYGGVDPHFFMCAMKLMAEFSVNCQVRLVVGDSLVSRARNLLTAQFLNSDCSHMLMIDSDIKFTNEDIKRISTHGEDIVGGFYAKKKEGDGELVINTLDPQPEMDSDRRLTQVKYIGTGFLCVSRQVIDKMLAVYGDEIMYVSDSDGRTIEYDFWPVGVYKFPNGYRRYLSEDWYFCQRALDLGFKIYGDNGILLQHSGNALYPLSYQRNTLFRRVPANATSDSVPPVSLSPAQPEAALT